MKINRAYYRYTFAILCMTSLITSCSHQPDTLSNAPLSSDLINVSQKRLIESRLNSFYQDYRGTPYKFGGLTSKGMDCSGLVYKAYREYLGWNTPRTTELQLKAGKQINPSELKTSDLIFFRPENKGMHVGIYLDDNNGGRFLHASSSKGVIISQVRTGYWAPFLYQARRLNE